jgi:hypothetical protein
LPEEYEKCLIGLTAILREAWNTSQQTEDRRERIQVFHGEVSIFNGLKNIFYILLGLWQLVIRNNIVVRYETKSNIRT